MQKQQGIIHTCASMSLPYTALSHELMILLPTFPRFEVLGQPMQAASLQDRANEAERLAQELRGLQADLRASSTKVKELTVLNAGSHSSSSHHESDCLHRSRLYSFV